MTHRVSKNMLGTELLLELLYVIGSTEAGAVWCTSLNPDMLALINQHKLVRVEVQEDPDSGPTQKFSTLFFLTQRGRKFLLFWHLKELLWLVRTRPFLPFGRDFPLGYIISRLPLEELPEYLTHSNRHIRQDAKRRQDWLTQ